MAASGGIVKLPGGVASGSIVLDETIGLSWLTEFTGRVGFTQGNWMAYVKGGVAVADANYAGEGQLTAADPDDRQLVMLATARQLALGRGHISGACPPIGSGEIVVETAILVDRIEGDGVEGIQLAALPHLRSQAAAGVGQVNAVGLDATPEHQRAKRGLLDAGLLQLRIGEDHAQAGQAADMAWLLSTGDPRVMVSETLSDAWLDAHVGPSTLPPDESRF